MRTQFGGTNLHFLERRCYNRIHTSFIQASRGGVILSNGGGSGDDGENGDGGPLMIIMVAVVGRRHMFRQ